MNQSSAIKIVCRTSTDLRFRCACLPQHFVGELNSPIQEKSILFAVFGGPVSGVQYSLLIAPPLIRWRLLLMPSYQHSLERQAFTPSLSYLLHHNNLAPIAHLLLKTKCYISMRAPFCKRQYFLGCSDIAELEQNVSTGLLYPLSVGE